MIRPSEFDTIAGRRWAARNLAAVIAIFIGALPLIARAAAGRSPSEAPLVMLAGLLGAAPFVYLALRMTLREAADEATLGLAQGAVFAGRISAFCLLGIAASPFLAAAALMTGVMFIALPLVGVLTIAKDANVAILALSGAALLALLRPLSRALREIQDVGRVEPSAALRVVGPAAFAGALVMFALPLAGRSRGVQLPPEFVAQEARADAMRSAAGALYEIERCAQLYSSSHAGAFPDSLPGLWLNEPRCHGTKIQTVQARGIDVRYRARQGADGMAPTAFDAAARIDSVHDPLRSGLLTSESGVLLPLPGRLTSDVASFWPDSTTPLRPSAPFARVASAAAACADSGYWDGSRGGYPIELMKVQSKPVSAHCGFGYGVSPIIFAGSVYDMRYLPIDTAGGIARGFTVSARPRSYGVDGFRSYAFTFRNHRADGAHATPADRAPNDDDPPPQRCETDSLVPCQLRR